MRLIRRAIVVALLLALVPFALARAADGEEKDKATLVREAFDSPYGKALTAELGKSLRASAEPACLADKGVTADQLEPRGRDLIIKWGTRMMEGAAALIDRQTAENPFPGAAELKGLKRDADVKHYLAMEEPLRQAKILDLIFEHFDRYVRIKRIKLAAVSPLATGNEDLLRLNPSEAVMDAQDKFLSSHPTQALQRLLQLSEQEAEARTAAIKKIAVVPPLPHTFFQGAENDLAELCIRSKR